MPEPSVTRRHAGFTLAELLVLVVVVAVLFSLLVPAVASARARSRASSCLSHLRHLGTAAAMYEVDSGGVVVTAGWGGTDGVEITWDDLLDSYLGGSLTREGKNQASYIAEKTAPDLWCPADRSRREEDRQAPPGVNRRSYAMPQYLFDPERAPWPPRSRSRAGVGIVWDFRPGSPAKETTRQLWQSADYFQSGDLVYARKPQRQPAVESGQVRAPAVTILFAEQPAGPGWRGALAGAVITVPAVQQEIDPFEEARAIGPRKAPAELRREPWHGERFHYLMVDGHAEPLPPSKTVLPGASLRRQSGMWTISARD